MLSEVLGFIFSVKYSKVTLTTITDDSIFFLVFYTNNSIVYRIFDFLENEKNNACVCMHL